MHFGPDEQVAEDVRAYDATGVTHLFLGLGANGLNESLDRMEQFMSSVASLA
jgi:hypothetical protein